ncbi:MAG: VWA domain-containing protein [Desulfobacterales bacterium]|nr:VWA domain-containing protein [Desulfobacterales bacterium]
MNNEKWRKWRHRPFKVLALFITAWLGVMTAGPVDARAFKALVDCRVELDQAILPVGGPRKAVLKITLDASLPDTPQNRPDVNVALVLDRSGSMAGEKLIKAKEAAIEALGRLGGKDLFSAVVYNHAVDTVVPAQSAGNAAWIEARIRQIDPGGNTALFAGVSQGAAEVRKNLGNRYVHRILLLSDGLANVGPSAPGDLGRLGAALLKENISVTTVGLGDDYNEDLMTRLSQESDGNSYFVESSRDLPRIFSAELGDVLKVAAKKVHLLIECAEGVRPLATIGRDGRVEGRMVTLFMNQLYGGQNKFALVEIEISGGRSGEVVDIARARASYENPFTLQTEHVSGIARAKFSGDMKKVAHSANVVVKRDYLLNLNALAQEKAISLSDKGKKDAALLQLKESILRLKKGGRSYQDPVLLKKAEEMEAQAERIEKEGMTSKHRKILRTGSYQVKNQQMNK